MKRIAIIVFLCLGLFALPSRAQVIHTHPVHLGYDWTSYGAISSDPTFGQGFWGNYMVCHFACMYPQFTNSFLNESRGGASWDFQFQTDMPSLFPVWRSWQDQEASATYDDIELEPISDNGGFQTTNEVFTAGTNLNICPPLFWNGSAVVDETANLSYHPKRWFLGGIPGSFPAATNRDLACIQLMQFLYSQNLPGLLGPMMAAGWLVDLTAATPVLGFFTGGHPYAAGHLFMFAATIREMNEDTNAGNFTVNWNDASCSTNLVTITGNSRAGLRFTGKVLFQKMPPPFDIPNGTYTNNCWPALSLDPSLAHLYSWYIKGTNFPSGAIITAKLDGQFWFSISSDEFNANGANLYTNFNGPLGAQRFLILNDARDQQGMDHVSLAQAHGAGTAGVNGWQDSVNVGSQIFGGTGRGEQFMALYNDSTIHQAITNYFQFDVKMNHDAQQTVHTLTLDVSGVVPHMRLNFQ